MRKHIIVSGCSFTNWGKYNWPDFLDQNNITVHNIGRCGSCNEKIIQDVYSTAATFFPIENNDHVVIIIQLTGLERVLINGICSPTIRSLYETKSKFNWFGFADPDENLNKFKKYFENEYTPELHLKKLFQEIITIQKNLNKHSHKVDYRFFLGWDIFHTSKNNMWLQNEKYINKDTKLLIEEYPKCKELWNQIDLKKFWFFNNNFVNYGGMSQWIQYNLESKDWYKDFSKNDFHPSREGHEKFAREIIQPLVNDMFNKLEKKT